MKSGSDSIQKLIDFAKKELAEHEAEVERLKRFIAECEAQKLNDENT